MKTGAYYLGFGLEKLSRQLAPPPKHPETSQQDHAALRTVFTADALKPDLSGMPAGLIDTELSTCSTVKRVYS